MTIANRIAAVTKARPKAAKPAVKEDERRWARRKTSVSSGLIAYHPVKAPVECVIRDMSSTGARIELMPGWSDGFNSAEDVPPTFTLLLRLDKMEVDCEVVWRRTRQIGVRFKGVMRPLKRKIASRHAQPTPEKK